jgi:spore germination protein
MEIYVAQEGDSIRSVAEKFGISVERLIVDNGLTYPFDLVKGQALVIAHPRETHIVKEGDTLQSIADLYHVSVMQILRNNPFLLEREYIYPGETLVISYNTAGRITTIGFAYPYAKRETLIKILPNLTYLSILNYTIVDKGNITPFRDDADIIKTSLEYGTLPLLMIMTLMPQGEPNAEVEFNLLLSEEYQDNNVEQLMEIIKNKGYLGLNMVFNYLSEGSQQLYQNYVNKLSKRLRQEGLVFLISINYDVNNSNSQIDILQIDYSALSDSADGLLFLKFLWGMNDNPPSPVSNINHVESLISYVSTMVPSDKIIIGIPFLGYDWQLPFVQNKTTALLMSIHAVLQLAYDTGTSIQYDETSQTPFYYYNQMNIGIPIDHVVWFIDARSLEGLFDLVKKYSLVGSGIWNIMYYYPQLWTSINSQFDIVKLL